MLIKTDSRNYTNIADAIRELTGSTTQYKPSEMKPALDEYVPECVISYDTFDENGNVLTATAYGDVVKGFAGHQYLQNVNMPAATSIGDNAFYYSNITNIELPDSITSIGSSAFSGCPLETLSLPENITRIGGSAFEGCTKLAISSLPKNLVYIGIGAFAYCMKLAIKEFPRGVKDIQASAFLACANITELTFHEDISSISYMAFWYCTNLTKVTFKSKPSFIMPSSYGIFDYCKNLTEINVPWSEGEVAGAPWGATNATINYNYVGE